MKVNHIIHHHRLHRYSWTSYFFGGAFLAIGLVDLFVLKQELYHPLAVYMTIVPGAALLIRAMKPVGVLRGAAIIVGGILIGAMPMLLTSIEPSLLWTGVICGLMGAALMGLGFSPYPEKEHHPEF